MWNMNDQALLEQTLQAAQASVPLELASTHWGLEPWCDAVVRLPLADGRSVAFAVEVRRTVDRLETLHGLQQQARGLVQPPLLVAPYLSQTMAQACRALGLNFIDAAGNAHIDVPGCLVFVSGQRRSKQAQALPPHGVWGTANGLRVVFALLTQPGLVRQTQRDMAAQAGVALGSVGKTLRELQQMGHLSAGDAARRRLLARPALIQQWAQHYHVALRHKLQPQRYAVGAGRHWQDMTLQPGQAVWGAEVAAQRMDGYLQPAEATVYSWMPRTPFIVQQRLRPDTAGEVEVLDAFWPFSAQGGDPRLAPALLVYADLLASRDDRNREAAARLWEQLLHADDPA